MGVLDGQPVSAAITNPAFINKNQNDLMPNVLGLTHTGSGTSIADIQAAANKLYTATGASETQTGTVYNATANTIHNGDSYQTALAELADKFDSATGHMHTGTAGDGPLLNVVRSLAVSGNVAIHGDVTLTAASGVIATESGQNILFYADEYTTSPPPISSNGSPGTVLQVAKGDHTHQGVSSIAASGNSSITGAVILVSGSGITLGESGQNITISAASGGGSVTSVTFTGDGTVLSATPSSAVTTSGSVDATLLTQAANKFLVGPASGSNAAPTFRTIGSSDLSTAAFVPPTVQTFLTGSGTYTTPTSPRTPRYLKIRMVGGGGGASGSGAAGGTNGGTAGDTTFGSIATASGGLGGGYGGAAGGSGGATSLTTSSTVLQLVSIAGEGGQGGGVPAPGGYAQGGEGGVTPFGGAGAGGNPNGAGGQPATNSGSGSGGPGSGLSNESGSGGGAGGYIEFIITSPSSTYSYGVGSGGTGGNGGTGGSNAFAGASGVIIVEEIYQ